MWSAIMRGFIRAQQQDREFLRKQEATAPPARPRTPIDREIKQSEQKE